MGPLVVSAAIPFGVLDGLSGPLGAGVAREGSAVGILVPCDGGEDVVPDGLGGRVTAPVPAELEHGLAHVTGEGLGSEGFGVGDAHGVIRWSGRA